MDLIPVTDPSLLKRLEEPEEIYTPDDGLEEVTDPNILKMLETEGPLPIAEPKRPARWSPAVDTHVAEQERKLSKAGLPVTGSEDPAVLDAHMRKPKPVDMGDLGNEFLRSVGQQNFDLYAEALMIQHDLTGDPQAKDFADLLKRTAKSMEGGVAPRKAKENLTDVRSIQEAIDWAQASMGQGVGSTMGPLVGGGMGYFGGKKVGGKVGGKLGAGVGALFGSAPLSLGEMRKALIEEGVEDPKLRAEWAIKGGMAMAALDSALPASLASKIMSGGTRKAIQRGIIQRIMQGGAKGFAVEGATEGTQASIEYLVKKHASGKPVSAEEWAHAAFNEGAAGAVGGAGMGGVTGALPDQPIPDQTAPPPPPQPPPGTVPGELIAPPQPTSELKADRLTLEQQVSILQQQGFEDEQIVEMDDTEREAAAVEGQQAGIEPIGGLPSGDTETDPVEAEAPTPVTPPLPEETPQAPLPESAPIEVQEERGTRNKPQKVEAAQDLDEVRRRVDTEPTDSEKKANNYAHGHAKLHGFDISIENPKGSIRRGKNADGTEYESVMPADYGYLKRSRGRDEDHVDAYIGNNPESTRIFVIDQTNPNGKKIDEHKVIFAVNDEADAVHLYHQSFSDGEGINRIGAITETTPEQLRDWLAKGNVNHRFAKQKRFHAKPISEPLQPQVGEVRKASKRAKPPQSFVNWIIAQGGMRDDTGELKGMDAHRRWGLVKKTGRSADEIRELAVGAGYLVDSGRDFGGEAQTTKQDVYDAIAEELSGTKRYPVQDRQAAIASEIKAQAALGPEAPPEFDEWGPTLYGYFQRNGVEPSDFNQDDLKAAKAELELDPLQDVGELLDRIAIASELDDLADASEQQLQELPDPFIEELESDQDADQTAGAVPEAQPEVSGRGEEDQGPVGQESGPEEPEAVQSPGDGEPRPEQAAEAVSKSEASAKPAENIQEPSVEKTEAGNQTVFPGAEKITEAETAQRQADKPLKAKAPQKGADEGLFSDDSKQTDLIDRLRQKDVLTAAPLPKTDTPEFKAWFRNSKVVDEQGKPLQVYHGAIRSDRVVGRGRFDKKRATSGPMAFFTDSSEIASRYAESKPDTSFERPDHYKHWFKFKPKGMRSSVDIMQAWHFLTSEQRAEISKKLPHVVNYTAEGEEMDSGQYRLGDNTDWGLSGKDHWDFTIRQENRGNVLGAAVDIWLNGGSLINSEEEFMTILRLGGMPMESVTFDSPHATYPGVVPVYLSIQNPLDAGNIPQNVITALEKASKRTRKRSRDLGLDIWHKEMRDPRDWFESMAKDVAEGKNTHAWTSIPDWVTNTLKALGYDGIKDKGGKMGGQTHTVWIPFEETQVKSPFNKGTFDPTNPKILERAEDPKTGNLYQFVITDKQREHLKSRVNVIAKRIMGRTLPTIEFHDTLPGGFEGAFLADEWLIYLALQARTDPRLVLRHEAVHVLKNVGLFTSGEWATLSRLAQRKWIDQFQIRKRYEHYDKGRPNFDELMIEEAIADAYLHYSAHGPQKNAADLIFEKLKRLLEAIRNMLRGEGFTSVNDIFDKIESGQVAKRAEKKSRLFRPKTKIGQEVLTAAPQSDAFKRWFGKSKVVNEKGEPLVVYKGMYPFDWTQETADSPGPEIESIDRGTPFPAFNHGEDGVKVAGFFGDKQTASHFAEVMSGAVYPVYLSLQSPYIIDAKGRKAGTVQFGTSGREFRDAIRSGRYDGVIIRNTDDEGTIYVALRPTQIKSVHNRGTFDPNDPNILTAAQPPDGNWPTGSVTDPTVGPNPKEFQSNINLDKIAAPEDVKTVITTVGERAQQFITERRGVVSNEQTKELAKELGMNAAELAKRTTGQAFNAHEIYAARVLMVQSASTVRNLAAKASQTKTLHDLAQFQKAFTRHVAIQEQIAGMTAEAGRALQQFRMMAGANYLPIAKAMADEAKAKDKKAPFGAKTKTGSDAIVHLADMINALDDPSQLNRFTRDAFKVTIWDKIREIWINALLSGPRTHATNILSNFITALWQVPETSVAAAIGSLHGGDKVRAREATARLIGVIEGAKEGLSKATTAFITGEPTDAMSKVEQHRRKAVGGTVGEIVRIPSRALLAEDEFFKTLNRLAEINARAVRLALNEGLRGQALSQRIAEIKANPPPSLKRAADEWALYQTFQNHMGPIGTMVMRLRDTVPGLYLLMPFIRTPANLIKYAAERTPFGLMMGSVRENLSGQHGNIARDMQIARMGLGSSVALVIGSWAMAGVLTGSGPDDPDERRLWLEDHQPYAIKFGDTWISYQRLDPFGLILGVTADLIGLGGAVLKADGEKVGSMIVGALSQNLLNKTWLSGLSDFIEAVQDPTRYGEGYVRRMAGTLIPNLSAQIAQTIDPVLRDARTTLDNIKTRIPGMGKTLPPRRNIFGEPIRREGSYGPDLLSPLYLKTDTEDPVVNAMLEIDYAPSMPSRRINGHELTPEQYSEYAEIAGKAARVKIEPQVRGKGWRSMPPDRKIDKIKKAFDESRDLARKRMKRKYPELGKSPK